MKIEQSILHLYPKGQIFCQNRSISHGLADTSNFKFYHFCQKFENSKWPPFLEGGKCFMKIEQSILHLYPKGQKFCRNRSISHGLGDTSNFKFYHFCQKFENSIWPLFLEKGIFFLRIEQSILHIYRVGQKFCRNRSISHGYRCNLINVSPTSSIGYYKQSNLCLVSLLFSLFPISI